MVVRTRGFEKAKKIGAALFSIWCHQRRRFPQKRRRWSQECAEMESRLSPSLPPRWREDATIDDDGSETRLEGGGRGRGKQETREREREKKSGVHLLSDLSFDDDGYISERGLEGGGRGRGKGVIREREREKKSGFTFSPFRASMTMATFWSAEPIETRGGKKEKKEKEEKKENGGRRGRRGRKRKV